MVVCNVLDTIATVLTVVGEFAAGGAVVDPALSEVAELHPMTVTINTAETRSKAFIAQPPRIVQTIYSPDLPDRVSASLSMHCAARGRRPLEGEREWLRSQRKGRR